ncbi:MAG: DnaJ domain-containing protein [Myxococcales bacterium]|nr:DnaJ domain-containing protein [Myxococcales bacterium]
MNEALRRAGAAPVDDWLAPGAPPPAAPAASPPAQPVLHAEPTIELGATDIAEEPTAVLEAVPAPKPPPAITLEIPAAAPRESAPITLGAAEEWPTDEINLSEDSVTAPTTIPQEASSPDAPLEGFGVEPPPGSPSLWGTADSPAMQPLILGPNRQGEEDLWAIVEHERVTAPDIPLGSAFEDALQQMDSSLEQLVATPLPQQEAPVEAVIDVVEPAPAAPISDKASPPEHTDRGLPDANEEWLGDEDVAGDPSDPAEAARVRRQRLLRRAMENLGTLGPPQPRGEYQVARESASPEPAAQPAQTSAEERQLAEMIEARHRDVAAEKDHFAILGVGRQASRDQVKAAFLAAAKNFHPDRLPPALSHLSPKVTAVFEAIRAAYDELFDDVKRRAYLSRLEAGAPRAEAQSPRATAEAAELSKKGEAFFKRRDYPSAREHFEKAHALDPSGSSLAAAAWALYMDPARKSEAPRAKQMMADALKLDPNCDRAHYQLGVIARVDGDMERAERHFREAVRSNPKHLEANQELRLIEMRKRKEQPSKKGFFR